MKQKSTIYYNDLANHSDCMVKKEGFFYEGVLDENGCIEIKFGKLGIDVPKDISICELNKIKFEFQQVGEPFLATKVLKNRLASCGFIKFIANKICFPESIPEDMCKKIRGFFFDAEGKPEVIAIPLEGMLKVCGARPGYHVKECHSDEGITTCFIVKSKQPGCRPSHLKIYLYLILEAFLSTCVTISSNKHADC